MHGTKLVTIALLSLVAGCTATVTTGGRGSPPPATSPGPEGSPPPVSTAPETAPPPETTAPERTVPPGAGSVAEGVCRSSADCADGQTCQGAAGCDATWTCQPARPCTRDLAAYCGCDGATFRASGSCPGRPYASLGRCEGAPEGGPSKVSTPVERPSPLTPTKGGGSGAVSLPGMRCATSGDCPRGQSCEGPEGCDVAWTCQPARPCTRDLAPYCGCDGATFRASGSCPGRRYRHRGRCPAATADRPVGRPVAGACRSSADCGSGQSCRGGAGCDATWTCVPDGPCTADLAAFCGCDGTTFRASSTCPGRRYRSRGPCQP